MALIKCPDCGKNFSDQAAACPECGRPQKGAKIVGGFDKGQTVKPDFWHDPNVAAIVALIIIVPIVLMVFARGCSAGS